MTQSRGSWLANPSQPDALDLDEAGSPPSRPRMWTVRLPGKELPRARMPGKGVPRTLFKSGAWPPDSDTSTHLGLQSTRTFIKTQEELRPCPNQPSGPLLAISWF